MLVDQPGNAGHGSDHGICLAPHHSLVAFLDIGIGLQTDIRIQLLRQKEGCAIGHGGCPDTAVEPALCQAGAFRCPILHCVVQVVPLRNDDIAVIVTKDIRFFVFHRFDGILSLIISHKAESNTKPLSDLSVVIRDNASQASIVLLHSKWLSAAHDRNRQIVMFFEVFPLLRA